MDRYVLFPLLCLYVTIVQFGSLGRFSDVESSYGLSTGIVVVFVVLGAKRLLWAAISERVFWVLGALILYLILPSVLSPEPVRALLMLFQLLCYVALAAVVSRTQLSGSQVFLIWMCIAVGLFLSAALTIIDFAGIVDVPYNNNLWLSTKVGVDRVEQASGFFARRSGMAAIFSIGIAGSLVFALAHKSIAIRFFFLVAGSTGLLCVFLTHNRSGVLGSLAVVSAYALISPRFRGLRRIGMLMASIVIGIAFLLFIIRYYPQHAAVYGAKLGLLGSAEFNRESDHLRIDLFLAALESLGSKPLGNGFSLVELPGGVWMSAHNVVTAIIWAAGVFSLVWLPLFAATIFSYFMPGLSRRREVRKLVTVEHDAVVCGLFAWLANGMTHNSIQTGLAWLFFGVLIADRYFSARSMRESENGVDAAGESSAGEFASVGRESATVRSG